MISEQTKKAVTLMPFDKNASSFPSPFHREIWWWAVGIVPLDVSLTEAVLSQLSSDALEGCRQWHAYFLAFTEDMYAFADAYRPASARQYRDILEFIAAGGELRGDNIVWNLSDWDARRAKMNRSKAYATNGVDLDACLHALARTGLQCEISGDEVLFEHSAYPKIFHTMRLMENSPEARQTTVRYHFAHCEYRQLFKRYEGNWEELLRRASDESLTIVQSIYDFLRPQKIARYTHFGFIKYRHQGLRILDMNLYGDEYPTLRVNIGTCASSDADVGEDAYYEVLQNESPAVQEAFVEHLVRCEGQGHKHGVVVLNGREERVCPCERVRINPHSGDWEALRAFIAARKASIDRWAAGNGGKQ